jgi:hypothetical protein
METPRMIPYGRTGSGHAGNDSSRERQERNDATGLTSANQRAVLQALAVAKSEGITCGEVEDGLQLHHGAASSALSHLHRAGYITRIKMRRKRHEIYVLPEYVNGREESPYRPRERRPHPSELSDDVVAEAMMKGAKATGVRLGGPQALDLVKAILKELP